MLCLIFIESNQCCRYSAARSTENGRCSKRKSWSTLKPGKQCERFSLWAYVAAEKMVRLKRTGASIVGNLTYCSGKKHVKWLMNGYWWKWHPCVISIIEMLWLYHTNKFKLTQSDLVKFIPSLTKIHSLGGKHLQYVQMCSCRLKLI